MAASSATRKTAPSSTTLYVQIAAFNRHPSPDHVGIFVSEKPQGVTGNLFHVVNANDDDDTENGIIRLRYQELKDFNLNDARSFRRSKRAGTMLSSNLNRLRSICERSPYVFGMEATFMPNCVSWVDNILYDVNQAGIVSFHNTFRVPSSKSDLMPPLPPTK